MTQTLAGKAHYAADPEDRCRAAGLTETEGAVLALIAQGWTDPEIAASRDVTTRTIQGCVSRIYLKTGVGGGCARVKAALWFYDLLDEEEA